MQPTHLSFNKGIILIKSDAKVPYSTWDDRVRAFRAQGLYYGEIVEFLNKSDLSTIKDGVQDLGLFSQEVSLRGWGSSIKPPPRWKVGLCTVALLGDLGLFGLELPQIGKKGEHGPEGILGGFAALTVCVGLAILH